MRGITIRYNYDGPEEPWREAISAFVSAIDADEDVAGKFTYHVAVADDGASRVHWGRWDSQETLQTLQSRDYFKSFAAKLKALAGELETLPADVAFKTAK